jgi:hypothetical protein
MVALLGDVEDPGLLLHAGGDLVAAAAAAGNCVATTGGERDERRNQHCRCGTRG